MDMHVRYVLQGKRVEHVVGPDLGSCLMVQDDMFEFLNASRPVNPFIDDEHYRIHVRVADGPGAVSFEHAARLSLSGGKVPFSRGSRYVMSAGHDSLLHGAVCTKLKGLIDT